MRQLLPVIDHMPWWPVIAGSVFFSLFLILVLVTLNKSRTETYNKASRSLLDDDSRNVQEDGFK